MASKKCLIISCILAAVLVIVLVVVLCVVFLVILKKEDNKPSSETYGGPYKHAVVAADNGVCSDLGRDILKKNGSAVDSAITVMFCLGVMSMHSSGIGGGGFMLVYKRATKTAEVIDFREEAPGAANSTMYVNGTLSSRIGPIASGVPGEVKGYHTAWKRHGRLEWKDLLQPVIDMASKGVPLGEATYKAMNKSRDAIKKSPGLSEIFITKNGTFLKKGDLMNLTKLAKTLEIIRDKPDDFYTGKLAEQLVSDIQKNGGIITLEDMKNYTVKVRNSVHNKLGDHQWYSVPPPGSGAVLGMILNILKGYKMTPDDRSDKAKSILAYHRIIEAFKFGYAWRPYLGDEENVTKTVDKMINLAFADSIRQKINDNRTYTNRSYYGGFFAEDDGSTTHMSLLAPNGDAVGITSTINLYFGSKYRSASTGIIMNNQMDDFSTPGKSNYFGVPPSPANFIKPRKRPFSSSSPIVIANQNGGVQMVCGASGGTTITTSTALTVINYMWFGRTLKQSVDDPRLHHQLVPMYVKLDSMYDFDQEIVDGLKTFGHTFKDKFSAVVQAVARGNDGLLYGRSDPRKGGHSAGF